MTSSSNGGCNASGRRSSFWPGSRPQMFTIINRFNHWRAVGVEECQCQCASGRTSLWERYGRDGRLNVVKLVAPWELLGTGSRLASNRTHVVSNDCFFWQQATWTRAHARLQCPPGAIWATDITLERKTHLMQSSVIPKVILLYLLLS